MPTTTASTYRIHSIDILRGIVMIIMALDHTRDFFHETAFTADPLDAAITTPALFFTRWITHFCAPTFVLLSGISAYLASRNKTKAEASSFLIKRGLWLVLVEVTLVTLGLTFNPLYNFIILQVIWAIGWSMVVLGLLVRVSYYPIMIIGAVLFFGHNILDYLNLPASGATGNLWNILFRSRGAVIPLDSSHFIGVFYTILPWTGVMLLGYAVGVWFTKEFTPGKRKKYLIVTGISLTLLFVLLRVLKGYGDPGAWDGSSLFSFLNTSKYPPSLQYSAMTLGPALITLALVEKINAGWTRVVSVYGKVPFFYYILHFYLIHTLTVIVFFATGHTSSEIVDLRTPFLFRPVLFGFNLWIVYAVWIFVVAVLYKPCKWFSNYKAQHRRWWLSYV